jgi:ribosomal protein S18 acetylase RimI-like enzyme
LNINIREARLEDAAAIAKVHVDSWQTTYSALLPEEYIKKRTYQKRFNNWKKRLDATTKTETDYFIYVAEDPVEEIVGFVDGGLARGDSNFPGEIYALYILEADQRKGIGRSLVQAIASKLAQSGLTSIVVWVLASNPAVQFYQALDGQRVGQKLININGIEFTEIAYGWNDIQVLLTE